MMSTLKEAVPEIHQDVIFESCAFWTNRLDRMSQDNGNYWRK